MKKLHRRDFRLFEIRQKVQETTNEKESSQDARQNIMTAMMIARKNTFCQIGKEKEREEARQGSFTR